MYMRTTSFAIVRVACPAAKCIANRAPPATRLQLQRVFVPPRVRQPRRPRTYDQTTHAHFRTLFFARRCVPVTLLDVEEQPSGLLRLRRVLHLHVLRLRRVLHLQQHGHPRQRDPVLELWH